MKPLSILILLTIVSLSPGCGRKGAGSGNQASLDELNRAVSAVSMARAEFPPATNDLVEFLKLEGKTMPVAPAGKKLHLDSQTQQYSWVDANSK